jgi:dethiobiotin synthetase
VSTAGHLALFSPPITRYVPAMLFITGTDSGVGKTHFSCLLLRHLRQDGIQAVGFKPICCGDRDDAVQLAKASDDALTVNACNPVWMRFPAAPYTSSIIEERPIELGQIRDQWQTLRARFPSIVVEGAGGWCVPIQRNYSTADLARELNLPVVIVAANRLGVLNHTLLTLQAIEMAGLICAGIVLNNGVAPTDSVTITNRSILEDLLHGTAVGVLGEIDANQPALPKDMRQKLRPYF